MKKAKEIVEEYYRTIDCYKVDDIDGNNFFEKLSYFDNLDYTKINLYYVTYPYSEEHKDIEDKTEIEEKKCNIIINFMSLTTNYIHNKIKYIQRKEIDGIIQNSLHKANQIYFEALKKLKSLQKYEYNLVTNKDISKITKRVNIMFDSTICEKAIKPNKNEIKSFLNRLPNNGRAKKRLIDSIK